MLYTLLAVDDERWIRMGIVKMIDREASNIGDIFEAGTVREAMELYQRHHPDIVLTDVCFPAENGCTLGEYIFHDDPNVKIILISAYSEFAYVQKALRFHAANYLVKPVSKETLNQTIASCILELENKQAPRPQPKFYQESDDEINYSAGIVRKIVDRINENCAQKISLGDLAKEYHISEAYLSHVFKQEIGVALTIYVTQVRVEQACQLILMRKEKLRTIAKHVGYEDYRYFVRVFKKIMNVTPSEYQAQLADGNELYR